MKQKKNLFSQLFFSYFTEMDLFGCAENSEGEDVVFKGQINVSSQDLIEADEVWLVKIPRSFEPERLQGHEITLSDTTSSVLELNNGDKFEANVSKEKFQLPLVCPQDNSKERTRERTQHALKVVKAYTKYMEALEDGYDQLASEELEGIEDLEEEMEVLAKDCKGTITLSQHVDIGTVPKPEAEIIEKIPQPALKRRHPFFGLATPPSTIEKIEAEDEDVGRSAKKKKKKSSK